MSEFNIPCLQQDQSQIKLKKEIKKWDIPLAINNLNQTFQKYHYENNSRFSPCPNDTFIFDALINNKIDTEGLEFEAVISDVEDLNKWAFKKLDVTKLSYHVFICC